MITKGKGDQEASKEDVTSLNEDDRSQNVSNTSKPGHAEEKSNDLSEKKDEEEGEAHLDNSPSAPAKPLHKRQPSLSVQSKMRSSSFRRASLSQGPLSPGANGTNSPDLSLLSPDSDSVNSIYRKQAARVDELEKENRRLAKEAQEAEKKLEKTEEDLEELRETSGEIAELKSKAQKLDAQTDELNKAVCQRFYQLHCPCHGRIS